jgi:hypothetical protein
MSMQAKKEKAFELSSEDLKTLMKVGRSVRLAKGEEIFAAGDDPDTLWMVKEGRVHLTKTSSAGAESLVAFYGPGESFCVAASIIGKPFPCAARAATDTEVVAAGLGLQKLFEQLPSCQAPAQRDGPSSATPATAPQRGERGDPPGHHHAALDCQFRAGPSLHPPELAQMVNTTRSCIRTWNKKKGWIEGGRGEVQVKDRTALESMSQGD